MPSRRIKSLHQGLDFEDPVFAGKNIPLHREHRSKKGRKKNYGAAIERDFKIKKEKIRLKDVDNPIVF